MKIVIADDHQMMLDGLKNLLTLHFKGVEIFEAQNLKVLFENLGQQKIDLLLQDIKFGNDDARDFIHQIKSQYKDLKIIVITSISDSYSIREIVKLGIDGFILKTDSAENIVKAINECLAGKFFQSEETKTNVLSQTNKTIVLSRREKEVLTEILNEKSIKEIAQILFISEKTVEMHRSNLFIKLDVKNLAGLVKKTILFHLLED